MLPRDTVLGPLDVLEVFEYYDGPRLFTASNAAGHKYLAVWLGSEDRFDRWLYVPVSDARIADLKRGTIELREAFSRPEGDTAYRIRVDNATAANVTAVPAADLADRELPAAGFTLSEEPESSPVDAQFTNRELFEVALEFPNQRHEAPLITLGGVLQTLQKTVDAIGQALTEKAAAAGRISARITEQTRLTAAATFPSSFGLKITSEAQPILFGETLVSRCLAEVVTLLASGADETKLRENLRRLHGRTASRYGLLLAYVSGARATLKVNWRAARARSLVPARLSCDDAAAALAIIRRHEQQEPFEFDVTGTLLGAVLPGRRFLIHSDAEDRDYAGFILDSALAAAEHARMSASYRARIREVPEVSSATGEITSRYELVALTAVRH